MMNDLLNKKVVVIIGGAGLLGLAFCKAVIEQGGLVIIADKYCDPARRLQSDLSKQNLADKLTTMTVDITDSNSIDKLIDAAEKKHTKIDAVVNSAYPRNKAYGQDALEVSYASFCNNTDMHLGGYFLATQRFIHYFLKQGHGNIINLSSIYGFKAPQFELYDDVDFTMPVEYAVIKAGILQLTQYFAQYLKGKNIRINCLSPGGILAEQADTFIEKYNHLSLNKGMLEQNDVTGSLLFLLSDLSHYMNGQNLVVDDGFTL